MDFKEFYKLLDEAITKEVSDIKPSDDNYNLFLMNRYLSFYHSEIAIHIAKTTNRLGFIPDEENSFQCVKSVLPKLPKMFIQYVKKPAVISAQELEYSEDDIFGEARLQECSKREIRNIILDYAKRSGKRETV